MNNLDTFLSYIPKNISFEDIDNLLISDQNILRPLRGLAFEYLVDDIFLNHFKIKLHPGSGDSDIDRFFHSENKKISIQIKTPVIGLTKENKSVSFALGRVFIHTPDFNFCLTRSFFQFLLSKEYSTFPLNFNISKAKAIGT